MGLVTSIAVHALGLVTLPVVPDRMGWVSHDRSRERKGEADLGTFHLEVAHEVEDHEHLVGGEA